MPDASHDFGAHLRQAREQHGVSLHQIAERTKISVLALEALERNDISRLPGGIFTRAFVRAYAREVGLDPEDTVRRFLSRFPDAAGEETERSHEANPERIEVDESPTRGGAWRALAWSMPLLLGVAYFGAGGRIPWVGEQLARLTRPAAVEPQPAPPAPAAFDGAQAQGTQAAAPPPAVAEQASATPEAPAPTQGGDMPATMPAASQGPAETAALPPGGFRMTLAPREACWVSVRVGGASVFSALMRPGERKELVLEGAATLTVGNAGSFDFLINGQPGRSLGGPGQVVTARLTAENLKAFLDAR